jgi:hypothetical protein
VHRLFHKFHIELDKTRIAAKERAHDARPLVLKPSVRAGQWSIEAAELRAPATDIEVEIVSTVSR